MGAPAKTAPWAITSNGVTNFTRGQAQQFARELVTSQVYKDTLQERIKTKTLAPAIEQMLWYYAYGKPIEQVELTVQQGVEDLTQLPLDELTRRARDLATLIEEADGLEKAIDAEGGTVLPFKGNTTP